MWRPGSALSWRKLGALVEHLPPESATMTALRASHPEITEKAAANADPGSAPWSQAEMLLAAAVDSMRRLEWMYAAAHTKGTPPTAPEPVSRPGVKPKRKPAMTVAQYVAMTGQQPPLRLVKGHTARDGG